MTWDSYLVDAAGFFLQLFPCALLCFLPFGRDMLTAEKKHIYLAAAGVTLALAAVFPLILALPGDIPYSLYSLLGDICILAAAAILMTAYMLLVREHFKKKLLTVYVVIYYATLIYWLANLAYDLFLPLTGTWYPYLNTTYALAHILFYIFSMFTLFPLVCHFMRKSAAAFLREIEPERMRWEFFFASLSTAAYLALMIFADVTLVETKITKIIFLFLLTNQAMIYRLVLTGAVNRSREENALRAAHTQKLQYDRISADMERAARLRHDMRHHWNYLYSIAGSGSGDELRDYLAALTEQTNRRENEVFCRNFTVNALLQYYIGLARDEGITCSVAAECGDLGVSPEDLTVIIGNVLENAINACRRAGGDRTIDVAVGILHGEFTPEVVNTCPDITLSKDWEGADGFLPASAFLSAHGGGKGMASVSDLAGKYLGSAVFRYDGTAHTFTAQVILNKI